MLHEKDHHLEVLDVSQLSEQMAFNWRINHYMVPSGHMTIFLNKPRRKSCLFLLVFLHTFHYYLQHLCRARHPPEDHQPESQPVNLGQSSAQTMFHKEVKNMQNHSFLQFQSKTPEMNAQMTMHHLANLSQRHQD